MARVAPQLVEVHPDTKHAIVERARELLSSGDGADLQKDVTRYTSAEEVWAALTPTTFKGKKDPPLVLLSAKWLIKNRPKTLLDRAKLPADAVIPLAALKRIYEGLENPRTGFAKQITKLLPIVCVLTPQPNLDDAPTPSPDPSGKITEALISHLHRTWGEFTNRILGKQAGTPIDDFGVYVGWSSVYQATRDKSSRDRTKVRLEPEQLCYGASLEAAHTLFAHSLTTVWIVPEIRHSKGQRGVPFSSAWAAHLYHAATLGKSHLQTENTPWRQLVDLGESHCATLSHQVYGLEKLFRPPPAEPLAFAAGHTHGGLKGAQPVVCALHQRWTFAMLAPLEELDFSR